MPAGRPRSTMDLERVHCVFVHDIVEQLPTQSRALHRARELADAHMNSVVTIVRASQQALNTGQVRASDIVGTVINRNGKREVSWY